MKKWILAYTIILCMIPLTQLTGCSQNLVSDQLDIERFLPVQTMGFDKVGDTLVVSLATSGEQNTSALVMKTPGPNIESALTRLQDYSPKDELYYEHVQYIILGEDLAKDGIEPLLDWVERSPSMRMDTNVFLVKGSAEEAISSASGEMGDITEHLSSLDREANTRSQHVFSLLEIAAELSDRGTGLCSAVECVPSNGTAIGQQGAAGDALIPAGYGVLQNGKLLTFLTAEESLGVSLFRQDPTGTVITVDDTALELLTGRAEAKGIWSESGELTGLLITADMEAGILETNQDSLNVESLESAFSAAILEALESAVTRSMDLSCDFLALEESVFHKTPYSYPFSSDTWNSQFTELPVTFTVQGTIQRGFDRKE